MMRRCLLLTRTFIDKMLEKMPEKINGINSMSALRVFRFMISAVDLDGGLCHGNAKK